MQNNQYNKSFLASKQKFIGNTVYSSISEISLIFTSIFYIFAARILGKGEFGKFEAARGFVGLFIILILFGFTYSITKAIVRQREKTGLFLGNALIIQTIIAIFCYAGCLFIASILHHQYTLEVRRLIALIFISELLRCFILTLRAGCKALGNFRHDTMAVSAERFFLLAAGIPALLWGGGVFIVGSVLVVSRIISLVILFYLIKTSGFPVQLKPHMNMIKKLLSQSWIYVVQASFLRVYDYIDIVMLSLMRSFSDVGLYSAGRRIFEGLWFIPNMLTEATYPEINARNLVSQKAVTALFDKAFKFMLIISVMVSLGTVIIAPFLVHLVYGANYAGTEVVLILLGAAIVPSYLRFFFGNTLVAMNLQKKVVFYTVARSVVNVGLNIVLIIHYGYIGATVATAATEFFAFFAYLVLLNKIGLLKKAHWSFVYKPLLAVCIITPLIYLCRNLHSVGIFFLSVILYIIILWILRIFNQDEKEALKLFIKEKFKKRSL